MPDSRQQVATFPVYNEEMPANGPRVARVVSNIGDDGVGMVDLSSPQIDMQFVQAAYIDNPTAAVLTITHNATGFRFVAGAFTQGFYEVVATDDLRFAITSTIPSSTATVLFLNFPVSTAVTAIGGPGLVTSYGVVMTPNPAYAEGATVPLRVNAQGALLTSFASTPAVDAIPNFNNSRGGYVGAFTRVNTASTNAVLIRNTATIVGTLTLFNADMTPIFVRLFNKATAPIPGTDTPAFIFMVPANASLDIQLTHRFTVGLGMSATLNPGPLDATALTVVDKSGVSLNFN